MFTIEHLWAGNISLTVDGTQRENISNRKRRPWTLRAAQSGGNALFWGAMVRSHMFCRLRTHVSRISITDRSGRAGSQLWNNSWFCPVTVTGVITSRLLLVKTRRRILVKWVIFHPSKTVPPEKLKHCNGESCSDQRSKFWNCWYYSASIFKRFLSMTKCDFIKRYWHSDALLWN